MTGAGRALILTIVAASMQTPAPTPTATAAAWLQWGGPARNFVLAPSNLATSWPAAGPRRLWTRALGEGHSSILVDGARLFTMYRLPGAGRSPGEREAIVALDAATGKTVWQEEYAAPVAGLDFEYGAGPHATPLIVGHRLFAASSLKEIFALDKTTGKRLWSHDLIKEYNAPRPGRGYTCSPLAHGDLVIVTAGGPGQTIMAFRQATGELAWKAGDFTPAPAAPILIDVDGQTQLVVFGGDEIVGLDPGNGRRLWSHAHKTEWGLNISTPVWNAADRSLFVSSAYSTGSRLLDLRQAGGKTSVTERWFTNRMRVHIGSVIRTGGRASDRAAISVPRSSPRWTRRPARFCGRTVPSLARSCSTPAMFSSSSTKTASSGSRVSRPRGSTSSRGRRRCRGCPGHRRRSCRIGCTCGIAPA